MADTTSLRVDLFDGTRRPIDPEIEPLVQVFDGDSPSKKIGDSYKKANSIVFNDLPYSDNFADNFRVTATAKNYYDAGFVPLKMSKDETRVLNLMLLPKSYEFDFSEADWDGLAGSRPELFGFLRGGAPDDVTAKARYVQLMTQHSMAFAALLNITTALGDIRLPRDSGTTALGYFRQLIWDLASPEAPQQDRFFGYATRDLVDQVVAAAGQGDFAPELSPGALHPGATRSYKQVQFGEANVQLTFHENDPAPDGLVKVEPDIDYYKDPLAHALLEFIPNHFTEGKTNPVMAYALRWIAGKEQGLPDFDPLYVIVEKGG
jgi:hypothetical protein